MGFRPVRVCWSMREPLSPSIGSDADTFNCNNRHWSVEIGQMERRGKGECKESSPTIGPVCVVGGEIGRIHTMGCMSGWSDRLSGSQSHPCRPGKWLTVSGKRSQAASPIDGRRQTYHDRYYQQSVSPIRFYPVLSGQDRACECNGATVLDQQGVCRQWQLPLASWRWPEDVCDSNAASKGDLIIWWTY